MWFWSYLTNGQEIISSNIYIPEVLSIDDVPSDLIWHQIVTIAKELQVFGETGGGILVQPND